MAADESSLTFVDMYKAISILGSGSFGMVLEAQVLGEDNTRHAVKIIENSHSYRMKYIEREIDILSKLEHPNLLRYIRAWKETTPYDFHIEVGEDKCKKPGDSSRLLNLDKQPCTFIATEVCQSGTLSDYIKTRTEVNYQESKEYFQQITNGLHYLHSHGIIHRDLKPANVLIGLNGQIRVADFGLAKVQESEDQSHTRDIGTFNYWSPEMWEGKKYCSKTDIYSLGVIFAMLLSRIPIKFKDRRVDVQELRGLSDDDIQLLKKMLSRDPKDRPEAWQISVHLLKNSASSDYSSWFDSLYQPIKIVRVEGDTLIINAKIWQSKVHVVTISPRTDGPSTTYQKMKMLSHSKHPNVVSTIMDWEQTNPKGWDKKLLSQIQGVSTTSLDSIDGVLSLDFLKLDTMEGDHFYTATEFCKGRTLQDFINENAQVNTRQFRVEAWKLIHGILEGLKYLEGRNIMFTVSCLQPSNITISDEGIPKIGGFFGCQDGFYACPDIGSGADHLSDVYSLGVIAFQMLRKTSTPSALQAKIEEFKSSTHPCAKLLCSMVSEPSVRPSASQILQHEVFVNLGDPDFHGWSIRHNGNYVYTAKDYGCAQVEYNKPERPWRIGRIVPIPNGAKEVADGYEAHILMGRGANVKGKVFLYSKEAGNYFATQFSFDESVGEEVAFMQINGVDHLGAIVDLDKQQTLGDTKVIQFRPLWFPGEENEPNTLIALNIFTKDIMGETKIGLKLHFAAAFNCTVG